MPQEYRLSAATGLHKGDREYQQDQVAIIPHPRVAGCLLAVVADGMGGRSGGRKASNQVVHTATQLFERFLPNEDSPQDLLQRIVDESHTVIQLTAVAAEQEPHSTIAAFLVIPGGVCHWVHVGDSRVHHFQRGTPMLRTIDHSCVQALIDAGEIAPDEAEHHPQAGMLTQSLGAREAPQPSFRVMTGLQPGDALLACSDGLWQFVGEDELALLAELLPAQDATQAMVQRAHSRGKGSGDNISVALIKIEAPQG